MEVVNEMLTTLGEVDAGTVVMIGGMIFIRTDSNEFTVVNARDGSLESYGLSTTAVVCSKARLISA